MIQCKSGDVVAGLSSLSDLGFGQISEEVSGFWKRPRVGNGTYCVLSDEATYLSFSLH
jgi:hypothetical protein